MSAAEDAPAGPLEVRAELTFADLLAFQVMHFCTSAQGVRAKRVGQLFIVGSGLALAFAAWQLTNPSSWVLAAIVATAVLGSFFYPRQFIRSITKRLDKDLSRQKISHLIGPQTVRLTDEGVWIEDPRGRRTVPWAEVRHIRASNTHLYLYVEEAWAVIIPHRAFADDASAEAFVDRAVERVG